MREYGKWKQWTRLAQFMKYDHLLSFVIDLISLRMTKNQNTKTSGYLLFRFVIWKGKRPAYQALLCIFKLWRKQPVHTSLVNWSFSFWSSLMTWSEHKWHGNSKVIKSLNFCLSSSISKDSKGDFSRKSFFN